MDTKFWTSKGVVSIARARSAAKQVAKCNLNLVTVQKGHVTMVALNQHSIYVLHELHILLQKLYLNVLQLNQQLLYNDGIYKELEHTFYKLPAHDKKKT